MLGKSRRAAEPRPADCWKEWLTPTQAAGKRKQGEPPHHHPKRKLARPAGQAQTKYQESPSNDRSRSTGSSPAHEMARPASARGIPLDDSLASRTWHPSATRVAEWRSLPPTIPRPPVRFQACRLCSGNLDAKLFRKPLSDFLRQSVMHPPCAFFGRVQHRYRRGSSHRHAQPDQGR